MALFFLPGFAMSSWITRTPAIRDILQASPAEMGFVLMGLSVGSMVGILFSGWLVLRFGTRPVITVGATGTALSLPIIALGSGIASSVVVAAGLCVSGLAIGGGEVAMNVEGAEIEKLLARPFLPKVHGFFSLGATLGATLGIGFTALHVPVPLHLSIIAVGAFLLVPLAIREIPHGVGMSPRKSATRRAPRERLWRDPQLLLIGGIVLALALAEGSANDWLPLVMVDGHGFHPAMGSLSFAIFAGCMTVGRFSGGRLVARLGRRAVLLLSGLAGALGLGLVIFVDNQAIAATAVILWGLGAALGFPVAVSAAGASGADPARRVAFVATLGYIAFLAGPPTLGLIGETAGLRRALILVLALCVVAALLALRLHREQDPVLHA